MQDLKTVYSTPTEEAALIALDKLEEAWVKKFSWQSILGETTGLMLRHFSSTLMKYVKSFIPPMLLRLYTDNLEK
jgi:hypothetical protein